MYVSSFSFYYLCTQANLPFITGHESRNLLQFHVKADIGTPHLPLFNALASEALRIMKPKMKDRERNQEDFSFEDRHLLHDKMLKF